MWFLKQEFDKYRHKSIKQLKNELMKNNSNYTEKKIIKFIKNLLIGLIINAKSHLWKEKKY